jgi:hypothetical protein
MRPSHDGRETEQPELGPDEVVEVAEGRFSVLCPRHGVEAELRIETVSGSVRSFSCSVPGEEGPARRQCQAACARWVLGEA